MSKTRFVLPQHVIPAEYEYWDDLAVPPSRFSVVRLSSLEVCVVEDESELRSGHVHPAPFNPFAMPFWNWLALKVVSNLLVKFVNPRTFAASLDKQLQDETRGAVRCLRDGRYEVRVNDQFLDFVDLRHGLTLRIARPTEARRSPDREPMVVASHSPPSCRGRP